MSVTFADLGVPAPLIASLTARRIDAPFPIQAATIPDALAGRDICGRAPTGSGKTIAFGIPLVVGIGRAKPRRPRGLVLVPTRELAAQVCHELQLLSKPKGPWVEAFYGGVGFDRQIKALNRGVDIVVACPGRLADLINQRYLSLEEIEFVVIDEADRMADMGFLPEVRRLLDQCPPTRQTLLFSATLDGDVDVLIKKYQKDPARHEHVVDDEDLAKADHFFWQVSKEGRLTMAADVVKKIGPTIVFCRTKRGADRIARQLDAAGVKAAAIHGDRSQSQRERALYSFHQGKVVALVATDVAARGIHVDGVAGVVHYDPPADHKDYVHRSGRTARAGERGVVVSLVTPDLRKAVGSLQKELGHPIGLENADLDLLDLLDLTDLSADATEMNDEARRPIKTYAEPTPADERTLRPDNRVRPAPTDRPTRPSEPGREAPRLETVSDLRSTRPAARPVGESKPASKAASKHTPVHVDRVADLTGAALTEGPRRPSGASRRKAKRLAAAEATRLGLDVVADNETWTDDQRKAAAKRRPKSAGGSRGPRSGGSSSGAARSGAGRSTSSSGGRGASSSGSGARSGSRGTNTSGARTTPPHGR